MSTDGYDRNRPGRSARQPPEAELYDAYAERLLRIVGSQVRTAHENVEDACHFAWAKYLSHAERVHPDGARGWLAQTAIRQAWKLDGRQRREVSFEATANEAGELPMPSRLPGPAERAEHRDRLHQLTQLSERQQQLVWLQAAGLSYIEMAAYTGDSIRTVERQILRASSRVRELQHGRAQPALDRGPSTITRVGPGHAPRDRSFDDRGMER